MPVRGGGLGGIGGGTAPLTPGRELSDAFRVVACVGSVLDGRLVRRLSRPERAAGEPDAVPAFSFGRGAWDASFVSCNVRRAVSITISRPFRSSMSNLKLESVHTDGLYVQWGPTG